MNIAEFLAVEPPETCQRCHGSGIITIEAGYWTPQPCWCSACNGSGTAQVAANKQEGK